MHQPVPTPPSPSIGHSARSDTPRSNSRTPSVPRSRTRPIFSNAAFTSALNTALLLEDIMPCRHCPRNLLRTTWIQRPSTRLPPVTGASAVPPAHTPRRTDPSVGARGGAPVERVACPGLRESSAIPLGQPLTSHAGAVIIALVLSRPTQAACRIPSSHRHPQTFQFPARCHSPQQRYPVQLLL